MSTPPARRGAFGVAIAAALLLGLLAASQAQASTLYACVKKNGTAHIYSKKPKCKKGETKLSWNSAGPKGTTGPNGKNGTNGTNGVNGAVAGYFAAQSGIVTLPEEFELAPSAFAPEEELLVSKTVPAGSFLVSAKAEVFGEAKAAELGDADCELFDASTHATLDNAGWGASLQKYSGTTFLASGSMPLFAALSAGSSQVLQVWCWSTLLPGTKVTEKARFGNIMAVQASAIS
jgi:hypothetical protein